jgi:hypothetical protein
MPHHPKSCLRSSASSLRVLMFASTIFTGLFSFDCQKVEPPEAHPLATWGKLDAADGPSDSGSGGQSDAATISHTLDAADSGTQDAGESSAPLHGRYIGRGIWGVHHTGNLRIRIRDGLCDATYNAETSYFCNTNHRLRCSLKDGGQAAEVSEISCRQMCRNDIDDFTGTNGPHSISEPCYPAASGVHGTLTIGTNGQPTFQLSESVIKAYAPYRPRTEILMQTDTGPWR